jgi:hypothetical protein
MHAAGQRCPGMVPGSAGTGRLCTDLRPPRTYAPPVFMIDETGRRLIPLAAAEASRQFNLHTRVTRPRSTP